MNANSKSALIQFPLRVYSRPFAVELHGSGLKIRAFGGALC
jgi:hypothetical protein